LESVFWGMAKRPFRRGSAKTTRACKFAKTLELGLLRVVDRRRKKRRRGQPLKRVIRVRYWSASPQNKQKEGILTDWCWDLRGDEGGRVREGLLTASVCVCVCVCVCGYSGEDTPTQTFGPSVSLRRGKDFVGCRTGPISFRLNYREVATIPELELGGNWGDIAGRNYHHSLYPGSERKTQARPWRRPRFTLF
jgi:hypothetical protein